jgi:hypothetical protein
LFYPSAWSIGTMAFNSIAENDSYRFYVKDPPLSLGEWVMRIDILIFYLVWCYRENAVELD